MKLRNGNIPVYALASVIVIAEEFGRDQKTQSSTLSSHLRTGDGEVEVAENLYQRVYSMIALMITALSCASQLANHFRDRQKIHLTATE